MLKADELLIVLGKGVGEFFPPALLSRSSAEREGACGGPGDLVVSRAVSRLPVAQAGPGPFVPADLGGRPLSAAATVSPFCPCFP